MRRSFRTRVSFSGRIPRVCTLGWYAMPRWGMGFETRWTSRVSEMPLVPDIGNANVPFAPTGRVCGLLNQGGRIRPEGGGGWGADPADPERFAGDFDKTPFFP